MHTIYSKRANKIMASSAASSSAVSQDKKADNILPALYISQLANHVLVGRHLALIYPRPSTVGSMLITIVDDIHGTTIVELCENAAKAFELVLSVLHTYVQLFVHEEETAGIDHLYNNICDFREKRLIPLQTSIQVGPMNKLVKGKEKRDE